MFDQKIQLSRRQFLIASGASGMACCASPVSATESPQGTRLIRSIKSQMLWDNRHGEATTWFHPRACMVPGVDGKRFALMTLQSITGSDYFGPVHWTRSDDFGQSWSAPEPIESLGRRPVPGHDGLLQGVCDVVPEYHAPTSTVLALGHVVFYRGNRFSGDDQLARYPVYTVRQQDGTWSESRRLEWDDPRGRFIYTNNCGQRVILPDGDILLAMSFGPTGKNRSVAGVRCAFDGQKLTIREVGPALTHPHKRGLLEPSVTQFQDRVYLTIRAEDGRGYVSRSDDGLRWKEKQAWTWDNGDPVVMSTTQQHWLTHSQGLFLVYTRKHPSNLNVIRWRAPLFVSRVDPERLVLIRETEQVVQPLVGDGVKDPNHVALMGNFHVTNASPQESWVTVGSWLPREKARGAAYLSRIEWKQPNHQS